MLHTRTRNLRSAPPRKIALLLAAALSMVAGGGCALTGPSIRLSESIGVAEYWERGSRGDLVVVRGTARMPRDGSTREEAEAVAKVRVLELVEKMVFNICTECPYHEKFRACVLEAVDTSTIVVRDLMIGGVSAVDTVDETTFTELISCVRMPRRG